MIFRIIFIVSWRRLHRKLIGVIDNSSLLFDNLYLKLFHTYLVGRSQIANRNGDENKFCTQYALDMKLHWSYVSISYWLSRCHDGLFRAYDIWLAYNAREHLFTATDYATTTSSASQDTRYASETAIMTSKYAIIWLCWTDRGASQILLWLF